MTVMDRALLKVRILMQGRLACLDLARSMVSDKAGLEIGGPSAVFRDSGGPLPIYRHVGSLDNCDISSQTTWASHSDAYTFCPGKTPGKNIFCDGSDLAVVADNSYDFVLSSHNLEHFANPIRALKEWQRVTRPDGSLILVLPNHVHTFDHMRKPTAVEHMVADFELDTQEDDLTHLPEIMQCHDLGMDRPAGSREEFYRRSLNNFSNRCLHHHVFDESNRAALLRRVGLTVLAVETALAFHIFLLAQPEAFIERRKDKAGGILIERAQLGFIHIP